MNLLQFAVLLVLVLSIHPNGLILQILRSSKARQLLGLACFQRVR